MKRLPHGATAGGIWEDTHLKFRVRVRYYDSKSRCYRVRILQSGFSFWAAVEDFGRGKRFVPATSRYDLIGEDNTAV